MKTQKGCWENSVIFSSDAATRNLPMPQIIPYPTHAATTSKLTGSQLPTWGRREASWKNCSQGGEGGERVLG